VGGEIFRTCPDRPCGPPSLLYDGYRVFPGGKERPGRDADPSPTFYCRGHEHVELSPYSPSGPYGLYRASVPVQRCTLPYSRAIPLLPLWAVRPVQSLSACTRVHVTFTHCIGGWVGPRAGLDEGGKSCPPPNRDSIPALSSL
jgi:hypothetical protein